MHTVGPSTTNRALAAILRQVEAKAGDGKAPVRLTARQVDAISEAAQRIGETPDND